MPDNLTFNIYFTSNLCLISITQKRHFPKLLGKCPKVQNLMKLNSPYAVKHAYFSIITHYYKQICCNFVAKSNYNISEITYFRYYSMIVATRPEPTVRPPSRYQTGVLRYTNSDFLCDLCGKIRIFRCVRVVFRNFCYHGVITVFLVFLAYFFLHS